MEDYSAIKTSLRTFEGCTTYMYLDTNGYVTVGVGHMLDCCEAAQELAFLLRENRNPASAEDIATGYQSVSGQSKGKACSAYQGCTALDLIEESIDELLEADISAKEDELRNKFSDYDGFPVEAQSALLDMAFNLGVRGLVTKFPRLTAAAKGKDWLTCAAECERNGVQKARNEWTREQFEKAAERTGQPTM